METVTLLLRISADIMGLAAIFLSGNTLSYLLTKEYMKYLSVFQNQSGTMLPVACFAINACWLHLQTWSYGVIVLELFAVINLFVCIAYMVSLGDQFDSMFMLGFKPRRNFDITKGNLPLLVLAANFFVVPIVKRLFMLFPTG